MQIRFADKPEVDRCVALSTFHKPELVRGNVKEHWDLVTTGAIMSTAERAASLHRMKEAGSFHYPLKEDSKYYHLVGIPPAKRRYLTAEEVLSATPVAPLESNTELHMAAFGTYSLMTPKKTNVKLDKIKDNTDDPCILYIANDLLYTTVQDLDLRCTRCRPGEGILHAGGVADDQCFEAYATHHRVIFEKTRTVAKGAGFGYEVISVDGAPDKGFFQAIGLGDASHNSVLKLNLIAAVYKQLEGHEL